MKRLIAVVGLLALTAPALADPPEEPKPTEERSALPAAEPASLEMSEAELDDVVAGGKKKCCSVTNIAVNFANVETTGGADVTVTQIALAGSLVFLGFPVVNGL